MLLGSGFYHSAFNIISFLPIFFEIKIIKAILQAFLWKIQNSSFDSMDLSRQFIITHEDYRPIFITFFLCYILV